MTSILRIGQWSLVHALFLCAFALINSPLRAQQLEVDKKWSQRFGGAIEFGDNIEELVVTKDGLYAVGSYSRVGNLPAEGVARWEGTHWEPLLGGTCNFEDPIRFNAYCEFQTVYAQNDTLYGLATVRTLDEPLVRFSLLRWDGAGWNSVYRWSSSTDFVNDVAVIGDSVYFAGLFNRELDDGSRESVRGVIRWDGQDWEALGRVTAFPGGSAAARSLAVFNDELYLGGAFAEVNDMPFNHLARWDGSAWQTVGDVDWERFRSVNSITASGDSLYVTGNYTDVLGAPTPYGIAIWDGTSWDTFEDPNASLTGAGRVVALGDSIFIQGNINNPDFGLSDTGNFKMAVYNGQSWQAVRGRFDGSALVGQVDMVAYEGELVVGFSQAVQRLTPDGFRSLDRLNTGLNGIVEDMVVDAEGLLYVVGDFNEAGGQPSVAVARWDGVSWETYGVTFDGSLGMVEVGDGVVYVASVAPLFPRATQVNGMPLTSVAMLKDGNWSPMPALLGSDAPQTILAMHAAGDDLYVAGHLKNENGEETSLVKWDGQAWRDLSGGFSFTHDIFDVTYYGNDLYIAGEFQQGSDAPASHIARWDGTAWQAIGNDDYPDQIILNLEVVADVIYASSFTSTYRWENGVWEDLGFMSSDVAIRGETLYAGGGEIRLPEVIMPAENCQFNVTGVIEYVDAEVHPLGSGTHFCNPPDFVQDWGENRVVKAMALGQKGIFIGGQFTYVGGFPSNYIAYWSFDLADVAVDVHPTGDALLLSTPFPNPSNGRISSTFTLSTSQEVSVAVYNVLGQHMATLIEGEQAAGEHRVVWQAEGVPAGLYLLKIVTATQTAVQKIIVTR
ncbi:MAG: T9SS type A sorting domain-containing protein [Bacteroidota bacterium]